MPSGAKLPGNWAISNRKECRSSTSEFVASIWPMPWRTLRCGHLDRCHGEKSPPGTLHLLELDLDTSAESDDQPTLLDAHSMDPMKVLRFVRSMGGRVRRVLLVGCEPADIGSDEDGRWE